MCNIQSLLALVWSLPVLFKIYYIYFKLLGSEIIVDVTNLGFLEFLRNWVQSCFLQCFQTNFKTNA